MSGPVVTCILALVLWAPACSWGSYSDKYDRWFKRYAQLWLPIPSEVYGWQILKAQGIQESRLIPDAVSPVGAMGIMQFMPRTFASYVPTLNALGADVDPFDPETSIHLGARYMASLRSSWTAHRPEKDRLQLAQASYNAGLGNILKSQRLCGSNLYSEI